MFVINCNLRSSGVLWCFNAFLYFIIEKLLLLCCQMWQYVNNHHAKILKLLLHLDIFGSVKQCFLLLVSFLLYKLFLLWLYWHGSSCVINEKLSKIKVIIGIINGKSCMSSIVHLNLLMCIWLMGMNKLCNMATIIAGMWMINATGEIVSEGVKTFTKLYSCGSFLKKVWWQKWKVYLKD